MNASKKGGETMNILSKTGNREIPFSRRFTLREIWTYLDTKYPENTRTNSKGSMKRSV
jgi:hypothetical protein